MLTNFKRPVTSVQLATGSTCGKCIKADVLTSIAIRKLLLAMDIHGHGIDALKYIGMAPGRKKIGY